MSVKKYRAFTGTLYPDSESYNCSELLERLELLFDKWGYILHDKDITEAGEPKKPHFHWVGYRKNPITVKTIANGFGLSENHVEFAKRGWKPVVGYLIHLNEPDKFQYSDDDVVSNFNFTAEVCDELSTEDKARIIFQYLLSEQANDDMLSVGQWALDNGCWSEFIRAYPYWSKVIKERNLNYGH